MKRIIINLFVGASLLAVPSLGLTAILAPKNATVPENRPLQPIPEFVAPDFGRSVNNLPENALPQEEQNTPVFSGDEPDQPGVLKKAGAWQFVALAAVVALVFALAAFAYKKGSEERH